MPDYAPVDLNGDNLVEFELNGQRVKAPAGTMLVDAAYALGVQIPVFCYEPRIGGPLGACRMCLVEIEGMRGLQTACSTPVQADMVVRTTSDLANDGQAGTIEILLENHPLDCPVCDKGGECPLQDHTMKFGEGTSNFIEMKRHFPKPLNLSPRIALDRERCISCFRCVRFSQEVAEDGALTMQERGDRSQITTLSGDPYEGRFTGNIVDLCPVGALTSIPYRFVSRPWDVTNTPSICGHCPVGCNLELTTRDGQVKRATGRPEPNYEVEEGWLCDKSRWGFPANLADSRLTTPIIRDGDEREANTLDAAADAAAVVLRDGGRVGVLIGAEATVEEAFVAQHIADALGAPVQRLGLPDAPLAQLRALSTAQLVDLDRATHIVVVGGDPANQQPIVELRLRKARRRGASITVIGPRAHAIERFATTSIRTHPGELRAGIDRLGALETDGTIVLWDQADLAAEADAAAALAAAAHAAGAHAIELGHEVNGAGMRALGIRPDGVLQAIQAGEIDTLLTVHADPTAGAGATEWGWAIGRVRYLVTLAAHRSPLTDLATVALPAASHYETEGVLVSMNGRAQRLRPGARPPEGAAPGWELLIAIAHRLGVPPAYRSAAGAFAAASAAHPALGGLTHDDLGVLGRPLPAAAQPATGPTPPPPSIAGDGLVMITTTRIYGDATAYRSDALTETRTPADITLHPDEAARHGLRPGANVRVRNHHGECVLPLTIDDAQQEGVAFIATGVPGSGVERLLPADHSLVRVELSPAG